MPKIVKIGWQLTKLLQKLSGLLFLAHPVHIYLRVCSASLKLVVHVHKIASLAGLQCPPPSAVAHSSVSDSASGCMALRTINDFPY